MKIVQFLLDYIEYIIGIKHINGIKTLKNFSSAKYKSIVAAKISMLYNLI